LRGWWEEKFVKKDNFGWKRENRKSGGVFGGLLGFLGFGCVLGVFFFFVFFFFGQALMILFQEWWTKSNEKNY